ncbi:tRNA (guanosine(37)-N1)-methyltransferase TrmD [Kroppenstedtia eburnea]|uniref:tRNA (guanine-N(1)-)-methyltransferase n=1 Tax=Kroppenstedtia eburnea TaxID=714067 RepID=A0A1N7J0U0_9BACL|nr:tRNA (guanosine(37)-N1)-methyltransferase TrmD [Kroppenstedtia eburnea]QKI82390.1 tRNA (guanosine(37)-N1)-methyltransferase TrmD [Kroppenstedtia eburnea]SIS42877.1 tRNA (Guanine37-N(1)-) methyltransferase [Kroppenstedtia eburnea]
MRFDVLTLFPEMFEGFFSSSVIGRAIEQGRVEVSLTNFRDYSTNKHRTVDDTPYGGGSGMVLKPEPLFRAVEELVRDEPIRPRVLMMSPQGVPFTQLKAEELAGHDRLILLCGHYEGFDERVRQHLVDEEISIGDYVLTGGELPAMVLMDSVIRLVSGVLGNESSAETDSFSMGLLEYPQYTRPADFRGWKVPDVLLSGHHAEIDRWRRHQSLLRTWERRPELLETAELSEEDRQFLKKLKEEAGGG